MTNEKHQDTWEELEAIHPYYSDVNEWGKPHKDNEAFNSYQRRWLRAYSALIERAVSEDFPLTRPFRKAIKKIKKRLSI
jgi:hypothetical protein